MKKYVLLIVLPVLIGTSFFTGCAANNNRNENAVQAEEVNEQKSIYIMAGKLETDNQVNVSSKISARVSDISVNVGSVVNQGDTVIKLDTQDLQAQVEQAQAALDSDKATYDASKKDYDRTKALVEAGAATEVQLETAQQQLTSAESGQKSAEEQLEMLKNGATETNIDVYKAEVKQTEEALKTAQIAFNNFLYSYSYVNNSWRSWVLLLV